MKLIFLDIDSVLNSTTGKEPYVSDMEVEKLKLFKKLIDDSGSSGVVITSERRYSKIDMGYKAQVFKQFNIPIIGETRRPKVEDLEDDRGKQIMDYLCCSTEEIDRMVIFDDNDDGISNLFQDVFVLVNRFFDLNDDAYKKALDILNQ